MERKDNSQFCAVLLNLVTKKTIEPNSDSDCDSDQLQETVKKIVSKSMTHVASGSSGLGVNTRESTDVQALIPQLMPVIVGAVTAAVADAVSRAMKKSVTMRNDLKMPRNSCYCCDAKTRPGGRVHFHE